MDSSVPRLGDLIDDFCPRCRLLLNHAIASFVDAKVVKVVCQTCHSEHPFFHGENILKKKAPKKPTRAFDQVLAKVTPAAAPAKDPPARKKKKPANKARNISRRTGRGPRGKR